MMLRALAKAKPSPPLIRRFCQVAELVRHYPKTDVTLLSNGLCVASEKAIDGHGETATVGVFIDTGSRYEVEEADNGVAHFLEHLFFKGTKGRTRERLEQEIENMGGHLNAYTSREQTVFYAQVFKKDVPKAMDILADILQNSRFTADSIEREKSVILREMEDIEGNLEEVIFDKLHYTAYRGTPLGRTILGPTENIEAMTRERILNYLQTHYVAPRMVIAGAGGIEHKDLVSLSEKLFGNLPKSAPDGKKAVKLPAVFTGSDYRCRDDSLHMGHFTLAFATCGWQDPDYFTLMVIQLLLGSWNKDVPGAALGRHSVSPLISGVINGGFATNIMTFNTLYSDTGLFGVYAVGFPTRLDAMANLVTKEISRLAFEVDLNALEEAKNHLKISLLSHLDGSKQICEDIGRQLLSHGRRLHPTELLARIDAIDASAVKLAARRFFHDRDHALAAIGPIWELPEYVDLRGRSFLRRF
jgi:processing peptidase subunit beta